MSEPVGPQYGLQPRLDHTEPVPVYDSRDVLTNVNDYADGSEYGGVPGLVQPPPHVPTASERRMQIMFIDPADPGTGVNPPELEGAFNSEPQ